jgi:hypothetical protein
LEQSLVKFRDVHAPRKDEDSSLARSTIARLMSSLLRYSYLLLLRSSDPSVFAMIATNLKAMNARAGNLQAMNTGDECRRGMQAI